MTTDSRNVRRITTSVAGFPAWRQNMVPNRLYALGQDPMTSEYFTYPHNGGTIEPPIGMYGSNPVRAGEFQYGWGGSLFVPELGTHGKLLITGTGENVLAEQVCSLDLGEDSPIYRVHEQPGYCTSLAQAQAEDADLFYDENYMTANYSAGYRSTHMCVIYQDEAAFVQQWDGQFPITRFNGWVFWRKVKDNMVRGLAPHGKRYEAGATVPADVMGNGAAGIFYTTRISIRGPWFYTTNPAGSSFPNYRPYSDYYASVYPGGYPTSYIKWQNATTKEWFRFPTPLPEYGAGGFSIPISMSAIYDAAVKRVYWQNTGTDGSLLYLDLSNGIANATVGGPLMITNMGDGNTGRSFYANHCITNGHPTKRLWFSREVAAKSLLMLDLATNSIYPLRNITGLPDTGIDSVSTAFWAFSWDEANQRVIITTNNNAGIRSFYFTIPSNHTSASAYTAYEVPIDQGGVSTEYSGDPPFIWQHGERSKLIPGLGVIITTQYRNRPIVYLPG